jgi:hypothetical protein
VVAVARGAPAERPLAVNAWIVMGLAYYSLAVSIVALARPHGASRATGCSMPAVAHDLPPMTLDDAKSSDCTCSPAEAVSFSGQTMTLIHEPGCATWPTADGGRIKARDGGGYRYEPAPQLNPIIRMLEERPPLPVTRVRGRPGSARGNSLPWPERHPKLYRRLPYWLRRRIIAHYLKGNA